MGNGSVINWSLYAGLPIPLYGPNPTRLATSTDSPCNAESKSGASLVDFDSPTHETALIGPAVLRAAESQNALRQPHLGYIVKSPDEYPGGETQVRKVVYEQKHWAAISITSNATARLENALRSGDEGFDPDSLAEIVFVEAREESVTRNYLVPRLDDLKGEVVRGFSEVWIPRVVREEGLRRNMARVPLAVNPGFGFRMTNLRPFDVPAAIPAVSVGLLCIPPLALTLPLGMLKRRNNVDGADRLAFIIPRDGNSHAHIFTNDHSPHNKTSPPCPSPNGSSGALRQPSNYNFPIYWMLNWVGMSALGLASENMSMVLGPPWFALWLIFWAITNVATSFYPLVLAPGIYRFGYAWPLHNIVAASRSIVFDVRNEIGRNFGVLFAWVCVSVLLFPVCTLIARRRAERGRMDEVGVRKEGNEVPR
ncbi:unnamed protein product [Tuber melanosporum]|uniref:(Perigord truffle) hypothetical protein n=1 Tax=Tuber melanosporum (strain Mel28) TaxID=656061 RepID=D5GMU0_TUBMM|nr:uncharacterized protein GSTUM_00010930001 [Tuber melanosporum]CAZ85833.1 unnamed protein product [Tuber melanosporum]